MIATEDRRFTARLRQDIDASVGPTDASLVFLGSTYNWFNWVPGFQFVGLRVVVRVADQVVLFKVHGNYHSLRKELWHGPVDDVITSGGARTARAEFPDGRYVSVGGRRASQQLVDLLS